MRCLPLTRSTSQMAVCSDSATSLIRKGIPGHPTGNLYVTLHMALPPAHADLAQQAYRDMAHALPFNPRAALGLG